ncbi:Hypothetical protein SRAE_X000033200 [Strongyloides ratti]|uniref:Uncharacterized protein n=1 Tax=Strongyloides ratti TaxID=34506 RepID=A0A090LMC2_STRRB|nr:Hypothetical protein SRAE_X000033200 [Strongyloides ratti]CEF71005.1 Hypothetical protein SRAE_X000033200 [Strongyloides ratti]
MSSAMNILSSFTIFVLFVSIIISDSIDSRDKNLIDSFNLKNDLTPVILNDENNHFIEKRQPKYNNNDGIQVNGKIENSNATFNQIKNGIQESQNSLIDLLEQMQTEFIKQLTSVQNQISKLYKTAKHLYSKTSSIY